MPLPPAAELVYQSKKQMSFDLSYIFSSDLSYAGKSVLMNEIFWKWTEFHGKYSHKRKKGCRFWTPLALDEKDSNPLREGEKFRHEHVVPKKVLREMIFCLENISPDRVHEFLDRFCIGVVVTRAEDKVLDEYKSSMPAEFVDGGSPDYMNPWLRYKKCKLVVLDTHNNNARVQFDVPSVSQ